MLRFIARFLGFWLLAAALVAAIVDGAKSIAASSLVMTPLVESLMTVAQLVGADESAILALPDATPWPLNLVLIWLMVAPTVGALAVPGIALLLVGAKKPRPSLGREFAT